MGNFTRFTFGQLPGVDALNESAQNSPGITSLISGNNLGVSLMNLPDAPQELPSSAAQHPMSEIARSRNQAVSGRLSRLIGLALCANFAIDLYFFAGGTYGSPSYSLIPWCIIVISFLAYLIPGMTLTRSATDIRNGRRGAAMAGLVMSVWALCLTVLALIYGMFAAKFLGTLILLSPQYISAVCLVVGEAFLLFYLSMELGLRRKRA